MGKASRNILKEQAIAAARKHNKVKKKRPDQAMEYGMKRSATKPGKQKSKHIMKQSFRKCVNEERHHENVRLFNSFLYNTRKSYK